jgi:hypothetical protein
MELLFRRKVCGFAVIHDGMALWGDVASDNNELQAPHRIEINLGNSGASTKIVRTKSCKTRRERKFEAESGLGADDFCNSWTFYDIP